MQKCLLLVDYINDICHPNEALGCFPMLNANDAFTKVNRLLAQARREQWLIVWVSVGFAPNYQDANLHSPIFARAKANHKLQRGSWGTQIIEDLDYQADEILLYKNVVSSFTATNLEHILRCQSVSQLYVAGVATEVAIQSTVRDAHDRGYQVTVIADCCGSSNAARHLASLEMLTYFATVINSDEIS